MKGLTEMKHETQDQFDLACRAAVIGITPQLFRALQKVRDDLLQPDKYVKRGFWKSIFFRGKSKEEAFNMRHPNYCIAGLASREAGWETTWGAAFSNRELQVLFALSDSPSTCTIP